MANRFLARLIILFALLAVGLLAGNNAYASGTPSSTADVYCDPSVTSNCWAAPAALTYCEGLIPGDGTAFVAPIVNCFTDTNSGIIPAFTQSFLTTAKTYYMPVVQAMLTLLVVIYGWQLVTGHVQQVQQTTFTLLFKIGGVFYFMLNAPTLYTEALSILDSLIAMIASAAGTASASLGGTGCVAAANLGAGGGGSTVDISTISSMWSIWDCLFGDLFGFASGHVQGAIGTFLLLMVVSKGVGLLIGTIALYVLSTLFFSLMRFIHIYIIAVLSFSFVFCVGYLFVPLILFKSTADAFQRWLNMLVSLILTPVIALGYMAMMLVALDVTVFTGPTSIWVAVSGATAGATGGDSSTDQFGQAVAVSNWADKFVDFFNIDHMNSSMAQGTGTPAPVTGANATSCANMDTSNTPATANANTSTPTPQNAGVAGTMRDEHTPGSTTTSNPSPGSAGFGVDLKGLKLACQNANNYNLNLLISFAGSALLIYVMYSLLHYIPSMAGNLVAQGSDLGLQQIFKGGQVPGQKAASAAIKAVGGK